MFGKIQETFSKIFKIIYKVEKSFIVCFFQKHLTSDFSKKTFTKNTLSINIVKHILSICNTFNMPKNN